MVKWGVLPAALAVALQLPLPAAATVFGTLGNFDVVNDTGETAHGFEIELEGLHLEDITDTFGGAGRSFPSDVERYGAPSVTAFDNGGVFGVRVSYQATFSAGAWSVGTPSGVLNTGGESCWKYGGIGYGPGTPCDHFGVGTAGNATRTTYSWLVASAADPSVLLRAASNIPAANWQVVQSPPPAPGQPAPPPVVVARIQAADGRGGLEPQFGPAMWVKVFTTEFEDRVALEDLVADNARVQQARSNTEIEWQLLQREPGNPDSGVIEAGDGAQVGPGAESVLRRYEFYAYSGSFDAETHEALVVDDSNPLPQELGSFLGAQNAAVNLQGNLAPVPEPASWALLGAGLTLLSWRRWRAGAAQLP